MWIGVGCSGVKTAPGIPLCACSVNSSPAIGLRFWNGWFLHCRNGDQSNITCGFSSAGVRQSILYFHFNIRFFVSQIT